MTTKLLVLLFAILSLAIYTRGCLANDMDVANKAKGSVVELTRDGRFVCSGFAVAGNVVATAAHCLDGKPTAYNGVSCPSDRVVANDGYDHVFVYTCASYPQWVEWSHLTPKTGDRVFVWGRPNGLPWLYREGYVAGSYTDDSGVLAPAGSPSTLIDLMGWHGDSGAPVFDKRGRVVGMVSCGYASFDRIFHLSCTYPFRFTKAQLKEVGID